MKIQNTIVRGVLCVLLTLLVGCEKSEKRDSSVASSSGASVSVRIIEGAGGLTTADMEAVKWTVEYWKLAKFGDACYTLQDLGNPLLGDERVITEFRKPVIEVGRFIGGITEADRLNGIEYKAPISLKAEVTRTCRVNRGNAGRVRLDSRERGTKGRWSEWKDAHLDKLLILELVRRNGKWEIPEYEKSTFNQVTEADIPK